MAATLDQTFVKAPRGPTVASSGETEQRSGLGAFVDALAQAYVNMPLFA